MTAIVTLPITSRSVLSYRHFSFLPSFPTSTIAATDATKFSSSSLKKRSYQTPSFTTATISDQKPQQNVIEILEQRGLIESMTSENFRLACSLRESHPPLKVYCGFNPTAESIHLGNLIAIIVLSWFQRCGHKPIAVLGGATGRVGDPSGKSTERPELDDATLEKNIKEEIEEIERKMKKPSYVPNSAQRRLAEELTRFVHGEEGLKEATKATEALRPGAATNLDWNTIEGIAQDVPSSSLAYDDVLNIPIVDLCVLSGLLESKSAVRRMLKQGGLYLNNSRVDNESKRIEDDDIVDGKVLLLSAGKKNKMVVRVS